MSDYTPTTEDIIRSFSIPTHRLVERGEGESFSEYLSRVSIEGHGHQMESEAAAHRWLAAHDAEVRAAVLAEQGEPEWEFGVTGFDPKKVVMKRTPGRKPGPWIPVEENGESNG